MRAGHAIAVATACALGTPAAAHAPGPVAPGDLWTHWSLDPWVILPLAAALWLYARGIAGLWSRLGRSSPALRGRHVGAFSAGALALAVALVSALDDLSGTLMSAHMVQHVLLVAVAPLLLVLGKPEVAWLWGLPAAWRRGLARGRTLRRLVTAGAPLARPVPAALLHGATLWIWHAPAIFDAAVENEALHVLEHTLFFGTALLFWRAVVRATAPMAAAAGVAASLVSLIQGGFLGALLSLSDRALYDAATRLAPLWGLTPLQDQQLAGTIMWVPAAAFYLGAGLVLASRVLGPAEPAARRPVSGPGTSGPV